MNVIALQFKVVIIRPRHRNLAHLGLLWKSRTDSLSSLSFSKQEEGVWAKRFTEYLSIQSKGRETNAAHTKWSVAWLNSWYALLHCGWTLYLRNVYLWDKVYQGKEKVQACIFVPKSSNILLYFPNQCYLLLCPSKDLGVINKYLHNTWKFSQSPISSQYHPTNQRNISP